MNAPSTISDEINRLHTEATRLATVSEQALHAALAAAWRAGQLLLEEKERVRRLMGTGAWLLWLEENFQGTPRTAQNYMRLARSVPNPSPLEGLSLRQVYLRLGIATEPKSRLGSATVEKLPEPIRLANRLLTALGSPVSASYRRDLQPLYTALRRLFEADGGMNFRHPGLSKTRA